MFLVTNYDCDLGSPHEIDAGPPCPEAANLSMSCLKYILKEINNEKHHHVVAANDGSDAG